MSSRSLVISLHDVSPHTQRDSAEILARLSHLGVVVRSLLIIPDHHRRGHFLQDDAFCRWLQERAAAGDEIVMHGYYHQRARRTAESLTAKLTTRVYTADEGEFFDIGRDSARDLVHRSREEFRTLGLNPTGFIAPAWLLGEEAEQALRELGCRYTTRLRSVDNLQHGRTHRSQSLVWSVRSGWRRQTSLLWNATLFRALAGNPLLRISIHPVDLHHGAIWSQIERLIRRALVDRTPLTYDAWLATTSAAISSPLN
ncbi:MAG TPA: polysaccharide deacetylase family protein [Chthoniobacteraceae bacterium]|jgi:hypothetical protein